MFKNKSLTIAILFLLIQLLSSCQTGQKPTTTSAAQSPTATKIIKPTGTRTAILPTKPAPSITPSITPTVRDASLMGTPLPSNLEEITTENAEQIQLLGTWGPGSPNIIQLSSDGQVLAVGTAIGVYFYDSRGFYQIAFKETPQPVINITFSSDNKHIALAQYGGNIDIYDRTTFTLINRLELVDLALPDTYKFDCVFFQEDALLISITRTNQKIYINQWSTDNFQPKIDFSIDNGLTSFINPNIGIVGVFTEENLILQSLLYPEDSRQILLPNSLTPAFWRQLVENEGDILQTSNGEDLLINDGATIQHWEVISEEITYQLADYPSTLPDPCQEVPDTCINKDGEISWECQETAPPPIETISLTPDNIMVLISRNDNIVEFRRAFDGLYTWDIEAHYKQISFSPGSEFFFGLREDGLIEKRSTENGTLSGTIDQHPGQLYNIAFSPDGREIALGLNSSLIQIKDTKDGESLSLLEGSASTLEFSPDGSLLAAGLTDGSIRIFTLENSGHFDLPGHLNSVTDLAFSENGQNLLSGSADCTIGLWDLEDRFRTQDIIPGKETPFRVRRVAFSPVKENQYLVGDQDSLFVASEKVKLSLLPTILISDLCLSQNEQTLAVTGGSTWLFRDIDEQAYISPIKLTTKGGHIALNKDGSLLVVGTENSLEFWSVKYANKYYTMPLKDKGLPGNDLIRLQFSPDNTLLALAYQNGLIDIFGIPSN